MEVFLVGRVWQEEPIINMLSILGQHHSLTLPRIGRHLNMHKQASEPQIMTAATPRSPPRLNRQLYNTTMCLFFILILPGKGLLNGKTRTCAKYYYDDHLDFMECKWQIILLGYIIALPRQARQARYITPLIQFKPLPPHPPSDLLFQFNFTNSRALNFKNPSDLKVPVTNGSY